MLDNRLKMCADMISGKGIVCDVGTDHALLAAHLITTGKCEKVIASDINEGPFESAHRTVEKYGISGKVDLVLSDGLKNIDGESVSDIIIAGMGGETIAKIISECPFDLEGIRLILQPMTKAEVLRKWLICNGFSVMSESGIEEGDKLYSVITATFDKLSYDLTEFESLRGFFSNDDEIGKKIRQKEAERLLKVSKSLKKAGKENEAVHYAAMGHRMVDGSKSIRISDVYSYLDEKYPLSLQESWDNSGYIVESDSDECSKILLTLDITNASVDESVNKCADLIISHHPVIFNPLKKIQADTPVYKLVRSGVGAICMHTNLDIAEGGTNTTIIKKMAEKLDISPNVEPLEDSGLGCIIELENVVHCDHFAAILKEVFNIDRVKVSICSENILSKIAICSGSGGSLWKLAKAKGCDALITGDVKHDIWIDANNSKFTVIDCGHFHTENIVLWELRRVLEEKFPMLDIEIAQSTTDPCEYY
ncbi:MAG: Nif3-like dinuclear metal center hexameric protein [Ruminococcus sp.]|nr:Nif3-like dinuclear metal center hexameric protein [Ruminococcus sp.]